jgi:hypothetical protein
MRQTNNMTYKRIRTILVGIVAVGILSGLAAQQNDRGEPDLDTSFTYQGQIRDAGIPINDSADVILSLWNAATDGSMVGKAQVFENITLIEGRFSVEPDFGDDAFDGSKRWTEIMFRSPSGVGEYLTLSPRQAVNAAPYALFALNGRVGPQGPQGEPGDDHWTIDAGTGDISYVNGRVGIGTNEPIALLEVAGAPGDYAVELPDASISSREILGGLPLAGRFETGYFTTQNGVLQRSWTTFIPNSGQLLVTLSAYADSCINLTFRIDGGDVGFISPSWNGYADHRTQMALIPILQGSHTIDIEVEWADNSGSVYGDVTVLLLTEEVISFTEQP